MILKNMIKRLTSNYNKQENSNIFKLFSVIAPEIEFLKNLSEKVSSWQGIDNAKGTTLDLIGEDVVQKRVGMSDEKYRPILKFKTSLIKSNADINSVNTSFKSIIGKKFVRLYEGYNYKKYKEPASIVVILNDFDINIPYKILDGLLAGGVRAFWCVEKETKSKIYIGSIVATGEIVTIYPYNIRLLENTGKVYIKNGYSTAYEKVSIMPKQ